MTGLSFLPLSGNGSLTVNVSTYCTVCTVLNEPFSDPYILQTIVAFGSAGEGTHPKVQLCRCSRTWTTYLWLCFSAFRPAESQI
jgi:hypothetical protein